MIEKIRKKYNKIPIAAKATLWFIVCSTLQKCVSLITTPIFTRIMSTEQYGQYSVYNSWLQIFFIFTSFRLSWAVFNKGMSKYENDRENYTSTMQMFSLGLTLVFLLVYLTFHSQFNALTELPTFIMLAMIVEMYFNAVVDLWTVKKRYEYAYKPVVVLTLGMVISNAALGILAVLFVEEKGYARIISAVIVSVIFGLGVFIYNHNRSSVCFVKEYAIYAVKFNIPLLPHYISQYILDQSDRIMIQKLSSTSSAGIYSVAYNAGMVMKIITQSINNAIIPWQYDKLKKKKYKEMDDTLFVIYIFVAVCVLVFSAFAPEIMKILADEKYYEAVYVIPPVAVGLFFLFMYNTFANIEFYYEQTKFTMYISMIGAAVNIILNYFGIMLFGYMAAAYTTLICYIIFAFGHYIYMTRCMKKAVGVVKVFNTKRLILISIFAVVFCMLIMFVYDEMLIRYVLILIICIVVYMKRKTIINILKSVREK